MNDLDETGPDGPRGGHLRLVWTNPTPPAPRKMSLDLAIERHLLGRDGLSQEAFLLAYAGTRRS